MKMEVRVGEFAFLSPTSGESRQTSRPLDGTQTPSPGPKVVETHLVGDREHKQGNVYEMAGTAQFDVVSGIPMVTAEGFAADSAAC